MRPALLCAAAMLPRQASRAAALHHLRGGGGCSARMSTAANLLDKSAVLEKFELLKTEEIAERGLMSSLYRHKQTGAEVLSIEADDENNVFSANFRTLPTDSTGVPHILEHSVLCGSRKYPLKEPFVELLKGSLKTFLNAMTAADKTMYPVASQNRKDFDNLVDVYLDAVLHPRILDPEVGARTFQQEGWHYEATGPDAPLQYKGVVFNEMKGVYSSPDSRNYRVLQQAIFRDHPVYSIDSGGDPRVIPQLTYEQFAAFHRRYYHPGNGRFYFYGSAAALPLEDRLAKLQEYLSDFGPPPRAEGDDLPLQPRAAAPYEVTESYAVDAAAAAEPKQYVTLGWLLNDAPLPPKTKLAFGVLNHLLLGTASSALEKPLMESGLGASVIGSAYSGSLQQASFSVGLKGVALGEGSKRAVVDLVLATLRQAAEGGFAPEAVAASMHAVEFRLRESGSSPMRGLSFLMASLSEWNYGRDPLSPLRFEAPLAELKAEVAATGGRVFEDLVREYLLDNPHRVTVALVPDASLGEALEAEEAAALESARASLSDEERAALAHETEALKAAQAAHDDPADLAKLPVLSVDDLERASRPLPIEVATVGGATLLTHEVPTDGLVFLDVALDLQRLPLDDVRAAGPAPRSHAHAHAPSPPPPPSDPTPTPPTL